MKKKKILERRGYLQEPNQHLQAMQAHEATENALVWADSGIFDHRVRQPQ